MREGECQRQGREPVGLGEGLCGGQGQLLGVSLVFSLAPFDKTSSFVILSPSLRTGPQPQPTLWKHVSTREREHGTLAVLVMYL